jgi:hypothetical protein
MTPRNYDKLAAALSGVTPEALEKTARKSERINLRATPDEKAAIEATAAALGLGLSEYIFALHQYAAARLSFKVARTPKKRK